MTERERLRRASTVMLASEGSSREPDWTEILDGPTPLHCEEKIPEVSGTVLVAWLARRGASALVAGATTREGISQAVRLRASLEEELARIGL